MDEDEKTPATNVDSADVDVGKIPEEQEVENETEEGKILDEELDEALEKEDGEIESEKPGFVDLEDEDVLDEAVRPGD